MKKILSYNLQSTFIIAILLLMSSTFGKAEGILSIAPSSADQAALYIGAGKTTAGNYGEFAWKDSDSKFYFNIQDAACEKAYFGFSVPVSNRNFSLSNPINGLMFRIVDPDGVIVNDLNCFGDYTDPITQEVWQKLDVNTANLSTRQAAINGPNQLLCADTF